MAMNGVLSGWQQHQALRPRASLPDEVHVWAVRLDRVDWRDEFVPGWLTEDEVVRAKRFLFERERRRFAVCRATLRAILGGYLGARPRDLTFRYGPRGKPYLDPQRHDDAIRFNVSHSDELALVAVSRGRELGVDIERVRPLDGIDDIVARQFGPSERLAFGRAATTARLSTFYRFWTLKEAYLKACAAGISQALEVDVSAAGDAPICLLDALGTGTKRHWTARTLHPAPEFIGALAVEGWRADTFTARMIDPLLTPCAFPDPARAVASAGVRDG
jgi:4'-phosphopantetheinyl transferase